MNPAQSVPKNEKEKRPDGPGLLFNKFGKMAAEGEQMIRDMRVKSDDDVRRLVDLAESKTGGFWGASLIKQCEGQPDDQAFVKMMLKKGR